MLNNKIFLAIVTILTLAISKNIFANQSLIIAASPSPHAEILRQVKPILAKEGIDLEIKEFSDYIQPNLAVAQNQVDANYFQHLPYLVTFNHDHKTDLVSLCALHLEPMGVYIASNQKPNWLKNIKKLLPDNLKIAVPNDPTNEGRALNLLAENGFLTLKKDTKYPTKRDIINNPHNLKITELDASILPRMLNANQIDLAVINSNFALSAKMNPLKDAIILEKFKNNPYANIIAVRPSDIKTDKIQKLLKAMQSDEVRNYIKEHYQGAIIAAF
jgi:D-methionine transport system substrate-binding protein